MSTESPASFTEIEVSSLAIPTGETSRQGKNKKDRGRSKSPRTPGKARERSKTPDPKTSENPSSPKKTKKEKSFELRIGQFNVLNLVRENCTYYGRNSYTKEAVERKVKWIGEQLKRMKADIVGFEEVFHEDVLLRAIVESGLYPTPYVACFGANGSSPCVALVSKYPIIEKESISKFPEGSLLDVEGAPIPISTFSRPILKCVIELPTKHNITVFVTHIKSKRPLVDNLKKNDQKEKALGHARSLVVRAAEAAAFRWLLVEEMLGNDRPVVVCGDLNDVVHSVTTQIITGTPPWKILPRWQKEHVWDVLLWSTNDVQIRQCDRDVTYSHIHNGRYEVLDHILVSQEFVRSNPNHIGYVNYLQIFNDHLIDETLLDFNYKRDLSQSDHGQVVAVLKIKPDSIAKKRLPAPDVEEESI